MSKLLDLVQYALTIIGIGALPYDWKKGVIILVANAVFGVARYHWSSEDTQDEE